MGGEGFAFYQQVIPGNFTFLGAGRPQPESRYSLHHPRCVVDEVALPVGTAWYATVAVEALKEAFGRS